MRREFPYVDRESARDAVSASMEALLTDAPLRVRRSAEHAERWMSVVARRGILRELRREARLQRLNDPDLLEAPNGVERLDAHLTVHALLDSLPPHQARVMRLFFAGVPVPCIAVILGLSTVSIYKRLRRALARMRRTYGR